MSSLKKFSAWQLFQVNTDRTIGYTAFFDTYEEALEGVLLLWDYEISLREWEDFDD